MQEFEQTPAVDQPIDDPRADQPANAEPRLADTAPPQASGAVQEMDPLEAQKERYLRLAAEYDNFRKRTAREVQQAAARGQGELIKRMLDSLDDLGRVAHVDSETAEPARVLEGVQMVERNLLKVLASFGVEVIDPVELPFDPNLHEAVTTQAAESPDEDHMVAQVYQRGYLLNGQLLRPARVVVKQYQ